MSSGDFKYNNRKLITFEIIATGNNAKTATDNACQKLMRAPNASKATRYNAARKQRNTNNPTTLVSALPTRFTDDLASCSPWSLARSTASGGMKGVSAILSTV